MAYLGIITLYLALSSSSIGLQSSLALNCDVFRFGGMTKVHDAIKVRNIRLHGTWTTLREIYGSADLTKDNFQPGETFSSIDSPYHIIMTKDIPDSVGLMSAGGKYIDLELLADDGTSKQSASSIIQMIQNSDTEKLPLPPILVHGKPGTGKSVVLSAIRTKLLTELPERLMSSGHIDEQFEDIYRNVQEINPNNYLVFFDDIHKKDNNAVEEILLDADSLSKAGARVVLSGDATTLRLLQGLNISSTTYETTEMTRTQVHEYLTNIWKEKIETATMGEFLKLKQSGRLDRILDEYVAVFSQALENTEFPRHPRMLKFLSSEFETRIWQRHEASKKYHVGCLDYMAGKIPEKTLPFIMQAITINMFDIYLDYATKYHGFSQKDVLRSLQNDATIESIDKYLQSASLITENKDGTLQYINSEFERFSNTWSLLSHINNPSYFDEVKDIFLEPSNNAVLEFINLQVNSIGVPNLKSFISRLDETQLHKVLDNILINGYDDLFVKFQQFVKREVLQSYFDSAYTPRNLPKRYLGLIQSSQAALNPNLLASLKPSVQKPQSRLEVLIENDMYQTFQSLQNRKINYKNIDYQEILKRAVSKSVPHPELVFSVLNYIKQQGKLSTINLHEILYHAVSAAGEESLEVADILIQAGANPKLSNYNGKTLAVVAVEWASRSLMKVVENKWRIPISSQGQALFEAALDTIPSSESTLNGAWDMINLVTTKQPTLSISVPKSTSSNEISPEDKSSPWAPVLMGSNRPLVTSVKSTINKAMTRITPPTKFDVTRDTLASRRHSVLNEIQADKKKLSYMQVLSKYDTSKSSLTSVDTKAYKEIISKASVNDVKDLKSIDKSRVVKNLVNTANTLKDVDVVGNIIKKGSFDTIPVSVLDVDTTIETRKWALSESRLNVEMEPASIPGSSKANADYLEGVVFPEVPHLDPGDDYLKGVVFPEAPHLDPGDEERLLKVKSPKKRKTAVCLSSRQRREANAGFCRFSWSDVDAIAEIPGKRKLDQLQINSDKFLNQMDVWQSSNHVEDKMKAHQISDLIYELENGGNNKIILTGKSKLLANDVLEHNGLIGYRQNEDLSEAMRQIYQSTGRKSNVIPKLSPMWRVVPVATMVGGTVIGLRSIIEECKQDGSNCTKNAALFTVATAMVPAEMILTNIKRTNVLIQTPKALQSLKWASKTTSLWSHAFNALAIGLDVYNVVDAGIAMDKCLHEPENCPNKMKVDLEITLTFSCVSLAISIATAVLTALAPALIVSGVGIIVGVVIAVVLLVGQTIALLVNDIVHFSSQYGTTTGEDIEYFFAKVFTGRPPAYLTARKRRTDWIRMLEQHAHEILASGEEYIIGYGMGTGIYYSDGTIKNSPAFIDMSKSNETNTHRKFDYIQPDSFKNITLLCALEPNPLFKDRTKNYIETATFKCLDSFVIVHKDRWHTANRETSYIVYDLMYVNYGNIIGSHEFNNMFWIYDSIIELNLLSNEKSFTITGGDKVSNTFQIKDIFHHMIEFYDTARQNVLDLSAVKDNNLEFSWYRYRVDRQEGKVKYSEKRKDHFLLNLRGQSPNLHVVGRSSKQEKFSCGFIQQEYGPDVRSINIDGKGGQSSDLMDIVNDCHVTILYPYTKIETHGAQTPDIPYVVHVSLNQHVIHDNQSRKQTESLIFPYGISRVAIVSHKTPLLASAVNVIYSYSQKSLMWHLMHADGSAMALNIKLYKRDLEVHNNTSTMDSVSTVFMDSVWNATIFPVILNNSKSDVEYIRQFNVFSKVSSPEIQHITEQYADMKTAILGTQYDLNVQFTYSPKNQMYHYGSKLNDSFLIQRNTIFLRGGDGEDTYLLNTDSSRSVWIDNYDSECTTDTLVISDKTCAHLHAELGSMDSKEFGSSVEDVTLYCSDDGTKDTVRHTIVLTEFLMSYESRHLYIAWLQSVYVLLPYNWIHNRTDTRKNIGLALLYDFSEVENGMAMRITSRDRYLILTGFRSGKIPLAAYRVGSNDLALTKKYGSFRSSYIILVNFFKEKTDDVADEWRELQFYTDNMTSLGEPPYNTFKGTEIPKPLTVNDIEKLYRIGLADITYQQQFPITSHLTETYHINASTETRKSYTIDRNTTMSEDSKEGILIIHGAEPRQFYAFRHSDGTSVVLSTNNINITITDWCSSVRHRINRIKFIKSLKSDPIVISHVSKLECQSHADNTYGDVFLNRLNQKFIDAHEQSLMPYSGNSDISRLTRCVGTIYIANVVGDESYRIVGFESLIEQINFARKICNPLFSLHNLRTISFQVIDGFLKNVLKTFELSIAEPADEKIISNLHEKIDEFDESHWANFQNDLSRNFTRMMANVSDSEKIILDTRSL